MSMTDHPIADHVLSRAIAVLEEMGAQPRLRPDLVVHARQHPAVPVSWVLTWTEANGAIWRATGGTLVLLGRSVELWLRRQAGEAIPAIPRWTGGRMLYQGRAVDTLCSHGRPVAGGA